MVAHKSAKLVQTALPAKSSAVRKHGPVASRHRQHEGETMIRNIRALGIALMAVFALSAVAAQTAAAGENLTIEGIVAPAKGFATGTKTTTHVFATPNGEVVCSTISFPSEAVQAGGTVSEVTVNPSYSGCTAFGFATAHVTNNGCHYLFTKPTDLGGGKWTFHPPHIVPTSGSTCNFTITPTFFGASVCTQTVENQTPTGGHVTATNGTAANGKMDVTLHTTLTGIHYKGTGGVCGENVTNTNATYTGDVTIECYKNAAHTEATGCTLS
jgi:hypothetical protein